MVGVELRTAPVRNTFPLQLNPLAIVELLRIRNLQLSVIQQQLQPTRLARLDEVPLPCQSPLFRQLFSQPAEYSHCLEPSELLPFPVVAGERFSLTFRVVSDLSLNASVQFALVLVVFDDHPHLIDAELTRTLLLGKKTAWGRTTVSFPSLAFTPKVTRFRDRNLAVCIVAPEHDFIQPFFISPCTT